MAYIPIICEIYKGEAYNEEKNIVRISNLFDDSDNKELVFDAYLVELGIYEKPDIRFHKVLAFFPESNIKKIAIINPEETKIGDDPIKIPMAFLIPKSKHRKIAGSIGNSSYNVNSDAGSQNIEDLQAFIPAGITKKHTLSDEDFDNEEDIKVCGIGLGKDGSILIRGPAGEISIGANGVRISGPLKFEESSTEKSGGLVKENITIMEIIPKTIVTPFPNRLPNIEKILSIGGIISTTFELGGKII